MRLKILVELEYSELLAVAEADARSWAERKLAGKAWDLSVLEASAHSPGKGTMIMRFLFEVTVARAVSQEIVKGWLAAPPSYFRVRRMDYVRD